MGSFHLADFVLAPYELAMFGKIVAHFLGVLISVPCFLGYSVCEVRSNS